MEIYIAMDQVNLVDADLVNTKSVFLKWFVCEICQQGIASKCKNLQGEITKREKCTASVPNKELCPNAENLIL